MHMGASRDKTGGEEEKEGVEKREAKEGEEVVDLGLEERWYDMV